MQEAVTIPWYIDWSFWAVIVALTAILLSQLPPVHHLLKKARIEVETYPYLSVEHVVGRPLLSVHLMLSNVGGKRVKIKHLNVHVFRDREKLFELPSFGYFQERQGSERILFTGFRLDPGSEWDHTVVFWKLRSREDERAYKDAEEKLREDILEKRNLLAEESKEVVDADQASVQPFLDIFEREFKWKAGEYRLDIKIEAQPASANREQQLHFTLFESDAARLRKATMGYKIGEGILFAARDPSSVNVNVTFE